MFGLSILFAAEFYLLFLHFCEIAGNLSVSFHTPTTPTAGKPENSRSTARKRYRTPARSYRGRHIRSTNKKDPLTGIPYTIFQTPLFAEASRGKSEI